MNDLQNDIRRSIGYVAAPKVRQIIERKSPLVTEGQLETAGRAYVHATVWSAAAHAVIDAARVVGRTIWKVTTWTAVGFAALWVVKHLPEILAWL